MNQEKTKLQKILAAGLVMFAFAALNVQFANGQVPERYRQAVEKSRGIITRTMAAQKIPGLSIAVAVDGVIIWSEGFGYADLENDLKVTPATRFRIGSVSKPMAAAAMARLYEQGKLDLDAPVQKYVPGFPSKGVVITARQLSGHLSGVRHYRRDPDPEKDEFLNRRTYYRNAAEGLTVFQDDPLDFPPGTKFGYSSYAFTLLSAAMEGASGLDFRELMRKEVFGPLSMTGTGPDDNRQIVRHRSRFYSLDTDKNVINASYIDRSYSFGGGGFISTSEDMARFGMAHLKAGYLKQETLTAMLTSQKTLDGKETGTGWGWRINRDKEGRLYYYHPGENVGGRAYLWAYPQEKVVVAMAHNLTGANPGSIIEIAAAFAEEKKNPNR